MRDKTTTLIAGLNYMYLLVSRKVRSVWTKAWRSAPAVFVLILLFETSYGEPNGSVSTLGSLEAIKAFMASPPNIESIVFSLERPLTTTNGAQYYHARWQHNAFYLRQLSSTDLTQLGSIAPFCCPLLDTRTSASTNQSQVVFSVPLGIGNISGSTNLDTRTSASTNQSQVVSSVPLGIGNISGSTNVAIPQNFGFCLGYLDDESWFVDRQGNLARFTYNPATKRKIAPNDLPPDCQYAQNTLSQVLHMGVPDLQLGSIVWHGDSFEVSSRISHYLFQGSLLASNDLVSAMQFRIISNKKDPDGQLPSREYIVDYKYTTNICETIKFPNEITVKLRLLDKYTIFSQIHILHLKANDALLDKSVFSPGSLLATNARTFFIRPNGVYELKNNKLSRSYDNIYSETLGTRVPQRVFYYSTIAITVVLALLALFKRQVQTA